MSGLFILVFLHLPITNTTFSFGHQWKALIFLFWRVKAQSLRNLEGTLPISSIYSYNSTGLSSGSIKKSQCSIPSHVYNEIHPERESERYCTPNRKSARIKKTSEHSCAFVVMIITWVGYKDILRHQKCLPDVYAPWKDLRIQNAEKDKRITYLNIPENK